MCWGARRVRAPLGGGATKIGRNNNKSNNPTKANTPFHSAACQLVLYAFMYELLLLLILCFLLACLLLPRGRHICPAPTAAGGHLPALPCRLCPVALPHSAHNRALQGARCERNCSYFTHAMLRLLGLVHVVGARSLAPATFQHSPPKPLTFRTSTTQASNPLPRSPAAVVESSAVVERWRLWRAAPFLGRQSAAGGHRQQQRRGA